MKLVWLVGSQAVGKMTVGQELMKITDLRLFHNHMTIEPVLEIFGSWHGKAINRMRDVIFEEFALSGAYGLIFTYVMAFNVPEEWTYVEKVNDIFRKQGAEIYFVELVADKHVRIQRNATENRLRNKPSKQNVILSQQRIENAEAVYRCESLPGEVNYEHYLRIDNTDLSPEDTARRIKEAFSL